MTSVVLLTHRSRYGNKTNKQGGSETVIGRALAAAPSLKVRFCLSFLLTFGHFCVSFASLLPRFSLIFGLIFGLKMAIIPEGPRVRHHKMHAATV